MTFDQADFQERHEKVRRRMEQEGLDALIAYSNAKVRGCVRYLGNYFTRWVGAQSQRDGSYQWFGSCAVLFPLEGDPVLVTDQPWDEERAKEVSLFKDTYYAENFGVEFGRMIAERGYRSVGIDNWFIYPAIHYLPLLEQAPDAGFSGTMLIEQSYRVKTEKEIELIRRAEQAAVAAVQAGFAAVDVGVSEYEFALATEHALREHGEIELAGASIISGGPRTATGSGLPAHDDAYVMQSGDWALFDICPSYAGYAGDISRMIVAGSLDDLDPELRDMYETTRRMNEEVIKAIKPGVTPLSLNQLAEQIARDAGFGENKIGLLGHSLGLDIHDPPDYYYDNEPLEENMCITVEPCLLMPGRAGTRVEDVVRVTRDGCEVLSAECSKELQDTSSRTAGGRFERAQAATPADG
jgi:Xaa-Pro aminopeptidase